MSNTDKGKKNLIEDLKKNPVKALGLIIYPYVLIIGVGIGLFYLHETNTMQSKKILPPVPTAAEPTDLQLKMPSSVPKADVMALSQPSDSMVAEGKKIFMTNCISCHGANGKGDGVAASGLKPSPRNFTSKEGWVNGPKISGIYKTLSEGVQGSAMVAFDTFSPQQKFALAQFIRATFVPNPPQDTKEDLQDLEQTYHLATAQVNPGQIPVKDAMIFIMREGKEKYQKITQVLDKINSDSQSDGAQIFERVTKNKIRALTALSSTGEWINNEKAFVDLVVNELNENGFNDKVHALSSNQWDTFYNYMSKYF